MSTHFPQIDIYLNFFIYIFFKSGYCSRNIFLVCALLFFSQFCTIDKRRYTVYYTLYTFSNKTISYTYTQFCYFEKRISHLECVLFLGQTIINRLHGCLSESRSVFLRFFSFSIVLVVVDFFSCRLTCLRIAIE